LSYVEYVSKQARKDLIHLLHDQVEREQGESVKVARAKGERVPRPNINAIVGSLINLSEMGVVKLLAGEYATSDQTLAKIIEEAYLRAPDETRSLILNDLETHRSKLDAAIASLKANGKA